MTGVAPLEALSGRVVLQRLVDVADAIELGHIRARQLPGQPPVDASDRPAGLPVVTLALGKVTLAHGERSFEATASARLYDFGVAAMSLTCKLAPMDWHALVAWVDALAPVSGPDPCGGAWDVVMQRMLAAAGLGVRHGERQPLAEQHLVLEVDAFEPAQDAGVLAQWLDLSRLLSGDAGTPSPDTRRRLLRHCFSHHADDLVAIGRQRCFIYRPVSTPGLVDVLEAAHARLLELRYYDTLLDAELPRMYALVARTHGPFNVLAPRRMADLARRLYTLVAEVTELTGRLDAGMQVAGRAHLARAYGAALELLQVAALDRAVERKLAIVRDTYAALYDEAAASRAGLLELIIIGLISLEIVLALFVH